MSAEETKTNLMDSVGSTLKDKNTWIGAAIGASLVFLLTND